MSSKITAKLLTMTQLSIGIVSIVSLLLNDISTTPAQAQSPFSSTSVSNESVNAASKLAQQGKLNAQQQNYREAIADFSRAILLDPNEADYYYQRGLILRELSDRQAAIQDFDEAILRDPNHAWAYLQRAGVALNFNSDRFIDLRDFNYRVISPNRADARATLDLRIARDLFTQQNDPVGLEIANELIQHFAGSLESETEPRF